MDQLFLQQIKIIQADSIDYTRALSPEVNTIDEINAVMDPIITYGKVKFNFKKKDYMFKS